MTFEKEKGVIIEEEEKEHYPGPHIFPDMAIELVEEMLIDAPSENKHIFGEISFGIRGIDKKPLFYPYDRVIENTIRWFYLFKETVELYQEIEKFPPIDLKTKGSSKRILTKEEKEYILSVARGAKLPLIAAAKQVLNEKNIEFLRRGYYYIKQVSLHLESLDKGELIKELQDKGLLPIKPEPEPKDEDIQKLSEETILSYIESVTPNDIISQEYYIKDNEGKDTEKRIDTQITMEKIDKKMEELKETIEKTKTPEFIPYNLTEEEAKEWRESANKTVKEIERKGEEPETFTDFVEEVAEKLPKPKIVDKVLGIFTKKDKTKEIEDPFKEDKPDPFDEAK